MQHPACEAIVVSHFAEKDTRLIWQEICNTLGRLMVTQCKAQDSSTFLTLTRLTTTDCWNGSQQTSSRYFAEQAHMHNDSANEPHNSGQLALFLWACIEGMPNLAKAATTHERSMHTDTIGFDISFDEHIKSLIWEARRHDANHGGLRMGPREVFMAITTPVLSHGSEPVAHKRMRECHPPRP
jgi:hypothetical protein